MPNYLNIGKIVNTHGIRGEVRIQSLTDHPEERYAKGSELVIELGRGEYTAVTVKSHRVHKSFDLLTFEEYTNINEVERFKTKMLQVDEALLPELDEGEYYTSQLIGAEVVDEADNHIGKLKEILFLPANDVWVVERSNKKDLLLPHIDSVILNVDIKQKKITVRVLEGLDVEDAD